MTTRGKRAGLIIAGIVSSGIMFVFMGMLLPYPYGLLWGVPLCGIILAVFILLAFFAVKSEDSKQVGKSPLSILKERYAKGEITKEEFEQMKKDLENS